MKFGKNIDLDMFYNLKEQLLKFLFTGGLVSNYASIFGDIFHFYIISTFKSSISMVIK